MVEGGMRKKKTEAWSKKPRIQGRTDGGSDPGVGRSIEKWIAICSVELKICTQLLLKQRDSGLWSRSPGRNNLIWRQ